MKIKTLFLVSALATLPAGAALAQPAAAPGPDAAQGTTTPAAPAAAPDATASAGAATTAQTATAETRSASTPGEGQAAATSSGPVATSLATAEDLKAGVTVFDSTGATVGTIESVTAGGAVIASGDLRAEVAAGSFAKNDRGLVIGMTKAEFEAAVNRAKS
jgi:hypothetical protein